MNKLNLALAFVPGIVGPSIPSVNQDIVLSTNYIGPLKANEYFPIQFKLTTKMESFLAQVAVLAEKPDKTLTTMYVSKTWELRKDFTFDKTIQLPNHLMGEDGVTYIIKIINYQTKAIVLQKRLFFKGVTSETYIVNNSLQATYTFPTYMYMIKDNLVFKLAKETFDFKVSNLEFFEKTYYYLDIGKFKFAYHGFGSYPNFEKLTFNIVDKYNLFPNMNMNNRQINIPIGLIKNSDNTYSFRFANNLYFDPNSLDVSLVKKDGYLVTNKLYLPRNKARLFSKTELYFEMKNMGINKNSFKIPMKYSYNTSTIGDCSNSMICVIGGIAND